MAACAALMLLSPRVRAQAVPRTSEVELTLRVCRDGPSVATADAERRAGEAEVGAIEPAQNASLILQHQHTLRGPSERESVAGIEFPLVLSGRRQVLRDAARARQRASNARAAADVFETALEFRAAYAEAALEQSRVAVLREQQQVLEALTGVLEQLAIRGESATYDVRRHRAEVRLQARQLASATARSAAATRRLAIWLGAPFEGGTPSLPTITTTALSAPERSQHHEVAVLRFTAQAAELETEAARRRWIPEPEIFAGYRQLESGHETGHGVSLGLSVPLTFFGHGEGAAMRARAEHALVRARAERLQRQYDAEREAAIAHLQGLESAFRESEQAVAEAAALRDGARQLYGAGEASIAEVLDAYRTAATAALDRLAALAELIAARLSIMRASGRQFDPQLDAACGSRRDAIR